MGKPTLQENDRRGMAAIRDLHASALSSSRIQRQLRGLGTEDTRLRTVLADIDTSDPVVVDAWAMLVKAVLIGRSNRRGSTWRGYTSNATGDSSLRQQYIEHGFNDDPRHRLRLPSANRTHTVRSRLGPGSGGNRADSYDRPASTRNEGAVEWELLTSASPYEILPLGQQPEDRTPGSGDLWHWLRDRTSYEEPQPGNTLDEAVGVIGIGPPSEPPLNLVRASPPPATIDFGSPSTATRTLPRILRSPTPPRPRGESRSPSPTPATRAWIAEFEANRSASNSEAGRSLLTLGRRRRDDDSGAMRRTRRADGSRDTRRDAIIIQSGPGEDGWYDGVVAREREWRRSHGLSFGVGDAAIPSEAGDEATAIGTGQETAAATGEGAGDGNANASRHAANSDTEGAGHESHGLARTMSLSAVGGGDRPIAPLPRRRTSHYHGASWTWEEV